MCLPMFFACMRHSSHSTSSGLHGSHAYLFLGQVEVAFREQTAGHNALLLFVHLALRLMEERLRNAFKELQAKQSEVCSRRGIIWRCILRSTRCT